MTGDLESRLGHRFAAPALRDRALTHSSVVEDHTQRKKGGRKGATHKAADTYERLEFLGDRVLGLVVARMLFDRFPAEPEGALARRHAALVCKDTLARVARTLDLGAEIRLDRGEEESGGRDNPTILADVCEALIAALYLDGGLETAERLIRRHWAPLIDEDLTPPKDAKTRLQEWALGRGLPLPRYDLAGRSGPDHKPTFAVAVTVEGQAPETAEGSSKRLAEQAAAEVLLARLETDTP